MGQHTTDATEATFDTEVLASEVPVLVDFWAAWCGPCRAIAPHLENIAEELDGQAKIVKVNADESRPLAVKYKVSALPTFLVFKGGAEVQRITGIGGGPAGLKQALESHI